MLDTLANRTFAHGTNAWTATDHTCYTIQSAGSQGFLSLLPIYVDHILYPTLTDSGCYTEVHHINGKGEDAGVVYSEMQVIIIIIIYLVTLFNKYINRVAKILEIVAFI